MINQFTTLVLNLPPDGNPFCAPGYQPISLPQALSGVYEILFPSHCSSYHKIYLMYCYLRVLESTGFSQEAGQQDVRITYALDAVSEYFRVNRLTKGGDASFEIITSGQFNKDNSSDYYYDSFQISQVGLTPKVLVYSQALQAYVNNSDKSPTPTQDYMITIQLAPGATTLSKAFKLGDSGMSCQLAGDFSKFNDTNKNWTVTVESPFVFDFAKLLATLKSNNSIVEDMLAYTSDSSQTYEDIYRKYFNPVYQLAALLLCYYDRVNKLWKTNA